MPKPKPAKRASPLSIETRQHIATAAQTIKAPQIASARWAIGARIVGILIVLCAIAFLFSGCMHTVTYDLDAGAHWHAAPINSDIR